MRTRQSRIGLARPVVRRRFSPGLLMYFTTFIFFFLFCVVVFSHLAEDSNERSGGSGKRFVAERRCAI